MCVDEIDLEDIASGEVRATAADAQELAQEVLRLRAAANAMWPLVDGVRAIVAEHYPDGSKHDDPEYERRRSVTAALVRAALDMREERTTATPVAQEM